MGTIKIEFDLPEFKDNLELNILIKRDGEVIATSSSSSVNTSAPIYNGGNQIIEGKQTNVMNMSPSTSNNSMNFNNIPKSMVDINI